MLKQKLMTKVSRNLKQGEWRPPWSLLSGSFNVTYDRRQTTVS